MGQAFSNSQTESNSDRDRSHSANPPPLEDNDHGQVPDLLYTSTSSPSLSSSRRRVLRSSRGSRRPNPLHYEPPARLLTRLQQRLRRPHRHNVSETSSLVSPAESMMDVDSSGTEPNNSTLPEDSSMNMDASAEVETTTSRSAAQEDDETDQSALSRLLTEVITTAVLDSLNQSYEDDNEGGRRRRRQEDEPPQEEGDDDQDEEGAQREASPEPNMTIQLPRELLGIPSEEQEDTTTNRTSLGSFFRMLRMPSSTFRNQTSEGETMPVFIIGYRATRRANQEEDEGQQGRRWVIYIISGNSQLPSSLFSDSPSYEDLMTLSNFLGPVRPITATSEQIQAIPITIYRKDQMTEMINDKCQVCLEEYAESQELRMLQCKHGFHKECIDRWLTEGRNCCPICRRVPVPHAAATQEED